MMEHEMRWVHISVASPDEFETHYLKFKYPNGYIGRAIGYLDNGKWEIEWSDDYAQSKHITHWLKEEEDESSSLHEIHARRITSIIVKKS